MNITVTVEQTKSAGTYEDTRTVTVTVEGALSDGERDSFDTKEHPSQRVLVSQPTHGNDRTSGDGQR